LHIFTYLVYKRKQKVKEKNLLPRLSELFLSVNFHPFLFKGAVCEQKGKLFFHQSMKSQNYCIILLYLFFSYGKLKNYFKKFAPMSARAIFVSLFFNIFD
jgi:hypothetical protein